MARKANSEVTSKKAASAASKVLRNPNSSKAAKTAAGTALSYSTLTALSCRSSNSDAFSLPTEKQTLKCRAMPKPLKLC